ncbi:hypothetical protein COU79_04505 [Candidatus Peregrinibacteria bacterium CG10_big_fil_rev_8_21_14_0_10_54_7]|nr:MAG: hypothetical protein COU79_04505 [Candidatus Peregrinibacteria bacterium CG10_big_fil_rev_8_21_14_0_10_54_7]
MTSKNSSTDRQLQRSIEHLEHTIRELPEQYAAVFHPGKNLLLHFLRGIVYGLGMITAVALVIPLAILLVQQVQWVPLFGNFLSEVVSRMEEVRSLK